MSAIRELPETKPSLVLDFTRTRRFHPKIEFLRNTNLFQDNIGQVDVSRINSPQYRVAPLNQGPRGIFVQGPVTNLIPTNTSFPGSVYGRESFVNNNVTETLSNIGPRGNPAITLTTTSNANAYTGSPGIYYILQPTAAAGFYSFSVYVKQASAKQTYAAVHIGNWPDGTGGTGPANLYCDFKTIVDERLRRAFPVGNGWWRIEITGYLHGNNTGLFAGVWVRDSINTPTASEAGLSLSISTPQLEMSEISSSGILTNGSQVTREGEYFTMDVGEYLGNNEFSYAAVTYSNMFTTPVRFADPGDTYNDWVGLSIRKEVADLHMRDSGGDKILSTSATNSGVAFTRDISICSFSNNTAKCEGFFNGEYLSPLGISANMNLNNKKILRVGVNGLNSVGKTILEQLIIWPRQLSRSEMLAVHNYLK